jgi:hypothetical protein
MSYRGLLWIALLSVGCSASGGGSAGASSGGASVSSGSTAPSGATPSSGAIPSSGTPEGTSGANTGSPEGSGATTSGSGTADAAGAGDDAASGSPVEEAGGAPEAAGGDDAGEGSSTTCPMLTTGWTEYHPPAIIQFEDGNFTTYPQGTNAQSTYCTYTATGGIELFHMTKDPAGRIQRCEARVQNEYTTGSNQFEGDVRVTAGNATCVHQVFLFLMLDAFPANGGEFHEHTGALLETGVFSKWVHVNTIHHVATGKADIYLDCVMKGSAPARPPTGTGWYNKYGVYAVNHAPPVDPMAQSEWKNVHFYRQ